MIKTSSLKKYVKSVFFPKSCPYCGKIISFTENGCIICSLSEYLLPENFCVHCNHRECICEYDGNRLNLSAPFIYIGRIRHYIHRYKFRKEIFFTDIFAKALADSVKKDFGDVKYDLVTFIPPNGNETDAYNPSKLISAAVADRLLCNHAALLRRTRVARKQHYLSYEERKNNMKDVFAVIDGISLKGKTVLICDDVKTTGNTLRQAEKALKAAGADRVYCCAIAVPVLAASLLDKEAENL